MFFLPLPLCKRCSNHKFPFFHFIRRILFSFFRFGWSMEKKKRFILSRFPIF